MTIGQHSEFRNWQHTNANGCTCKEHKLIEYSIRKDVYSIHDKGKISIPIYMLE